MPWLHALDAGPLASIVRVAVRLPITFVRSDVDGACVSKVSVRRSVLAFG